MTEYALYLESGPKQRKTMVHVLELLGCTSQGPTTPEALAATPAAIKDFLRFLQRHGGTTDPQAAFTTRIAAHVMEGYWLGNGDPTPGFAPDFETLAEQELETYLKRMDAMLSELLRIIQNLSPDQLHDQPHNDGRTIQAILEHLAESQSVYLRMAVGKVAGLSAATKAVLNQPVNLPIALDDLWRVTRTRWKALSSAERSALLPHGQVIWSARRGLRRTLEHQWEHLREISNRLGYPCS